LIKGGRTGDEWAKYRKSRKRCFAKKSTENLENMREKQYNLFVSQCIYFFCLIISFHPSASVCFVNTYARDWRMVWAIFGPYLDLVSPVFILAFLETVRLGLCRLGLGLA